MKKTLLPLLFALLTSVAQADSVFDLIGQGDAAQEAPPPKAKAPREEVPYCWVACKDGAKRMTTAFLVGGLSVLAGPLQPFVGPMHYRLSMQEYLDNLSKFYSGAVIRGRVTKVLDDPKYLSENKQEREILGPYIGLVHVDVDGPEMSPRLVFYKKDRKYEVGDIVDFKVVHQDSADLIKNDKSLNPEIENMTARVVSVYCRKDNNACQNDYDSSLGVISRHHDLRFSDSDWLFPPLALEQYREYLKTKQAKEKSKEVVAESAW